MEAERVKAATTNFAKAMPKLAPRERARARDEAEDMQAASSDWPSSSIHWLTPPWSLHDHSRPARPQSAGILSNPVQPGGASSHRLDQHGGRRWPRQPGALLQFHGDLQ